LEVRHPIWEFAMTNRAPNLATIALRGRSTTDCAPLRPFEGILRDGNGGR